MSQLAKTMTTFVIDISSVMGTPRTVIEETTDPLTDEVTTKEKTVTTLEWCLDYVARKTQEIMFAKLKTATMSIITFGSTRTENGVIKKNPEIEGYLGVDELTPLGQPSVATFDMIASLRAVGEDEGGHHPEALDAVVCAIDLMSDKARGGQAPTAKSYKRIIYLITAAASPMSKDSIDAIATRIREDNISLRVLGVDFDDPVIGFKEEDKDPIKAQNEQWWHEWLSTLPDSRLASAVDAIEQAKLPTVHLKNSSVYKTSLTFGDPAHALDRDTVLNIPVSMYKLTTRALPMSRRPISKFAEEAEASRRSQRGQAAASTSRPPIQPTPTPSFAFFDDSSVGPGAFGIENRKVFFLADQIKTVGMDNAQPLPEGAEQHFQRAFRLGASLIPITADLDVKWQSEKSFEIINFIKASTFKRHYLLGEISNVFADEKNLAAQCELSALVKAMSAQDKLAVVRYVRTDNAEPKIGILSPVERVEGQTTADYFHFAEAPFSEDLKRYMFPSLDRVVTSEGKELREHRSLPTPRMREAMDRLVDSMDLMHAFEETEPWFSVEDSFNPGIHRMKEAVAHRTLRPGGRESRELPRPHWEVDKFLDRPKEVKKLSVGPAEECKKLFAIRYIPQVKQATKMSFQKNSQKRAAHQQESRLAEADASEEASRTLDLSAAGVQDDESAFEQGLVEKEEEASKRLKDNSGQAKPVSPVASGSKVAPADDMNLDTDDEEEEEMLSARVLPSTTTKPKEEEAETATVRGSPESDEADVINRPPPVRLLTSDLIASFKMHIDDTSQDQANVLRALACLVITDFVAKGTTKGSEKRRLAVEAFREGRKAAAEYDEAPQWNWFLRRLKHKALGTASQDDDDKDGGAAEHDVDGSVSKALASAPVDTLRSFWEEECKGNFDVAGLITGDEDEGKRSEVTLQEARAFVA